MNFMNMFQISEIDHNIYLISDGVYFVLHGDCGSCSFDSVSSHLTGHILLFQVSFYLLFTVSTHTTWRSPEISAA